jgi:hypothetical protein
MAVDVLKIPVLKNPVDIRNDLEYNKLTQSIAYYYRNKYNININIISIYILY